MATKKTKSLTNLGKKIQKLRKQKGLTQEKMAEALGINRVYMGYIEQGRESPSLKILMKIAKKVGVKVEDLFHN